MKLKQIVTLQGQSSVGSAPPNSTKNENILGESSIYLYWTYRFPLITVTTTHTAVIVADTTL